MSEPSITELQGEIRYLRGLVESLSATLLRKVALDWHQTQSAETDMDAERLLREAEDCFGCAKVPGLRTEIAEGLQTAGHVLMAKAVAIASTLERRLAKNP